MNATVDAALTCWGFDGASYTLVAERENAVYRVDLVDRAVALRLHRNGYRSDAELRSELQWMAAVSAGGLHVPAPICARDGETLQHIDGVQVDVLSWLSGQTLDTLFADATPRTRREVFNALGTNMARLHDISDAWQPDPTFTRCAWDVDGLLGKAPVWDRFWDNPALTKADRDLFIRFRDKARATLQDIAPDLDCGLIHADLVPANVMIDDGDLRFIDFDDGGYGFRLFDVATALLKHIDAPDYGTLNTALIAGYKTTRSIDASHLDLFMALRALTYVGWNITRMTEAGGTARNARFIATAKRLVLAL